MSRGDLSILGAGGHAKIAISTAEEAGWIVVSLHDDDADKEGRSVLGHPVRSALSEARGKAHIAIGDNDRRQAIASAISLEWISLIHPSAQVHASVKIGHGSLICAGAIVQPDAVIGDHVIINTGAVVEHDCSVGNYSHVAPRACLAGSVAVGDGCLIGAGAIILPQISLGAWCVVGAGGVVTKNFGDKSAVAGVPARLL